MVQPVAAKSNHCNVNRDVCRPWNRSDRRRRRSVTLLLLASAAVCAYSIISLHNVTISQPALLDQVYSQNAQPSASLPSNSQQYVRYNKRGRVVMRKIDKIFAQDLSDITDDSILQRAAVNETVENKKPILQILQEAGITEGIDQATINMLPSWTTVKALYYSHSNASYNIASNPSSTLTRSSFGIGDPVILGRCDPKANSGMMLGVAGLFNSGTNALTYYLRANLIMPGYTSKTTVNTTNPYHNNSSGFQNSGILTQVPWDKHWFSSLRKTHTIQWMRHIDKARVLPVLVVRDPLTWFQSMQRAPYLVEFVNDEAVGNHTNSLLVPVRMPSVTGEQTWPTLLHLWNHWYRDYLSSDFPYLLVRLEDLWFQPHKTIRKLKECTGAMWRSDDEQFTYVVDASKWEHVRFQGPQSNLVSSMVKHCDLRRRVQNLTPDDLKVIAEVLSDDLMQQFGYNKNLLQ
ncbi:hypothetical protein MPSEU_001006300 [Mayamaea pseudoterrestris]|nr:hypothetical protein MPSEU_001006300 [Mayamaea pseudoterrestris]